MTDDQYIYEDQPQEDVPGGVPEDATQMDYWNSGQQDDGDGQVPVYDDASGDGGDQLPDDRQDRAPDPEDQMAPEQISDQFGDG